MVTGFLVSLPERLVRSLAAVVGAGVHETAELVLLRFVRRSRLYEATAKNLLRVVVELVGGVEQRRPEPPEAGEVAVRKGAGNAVELGSIAAFGFSPLWLLAAASDVAHGTRTYLDALERGSGTAAGLVDLPPPELSELRRSLA